MGLSLVLYDLYKIVIWRNREPVYDRGGGYGSGDTPTYNNMELTGLSGPANKYWFELLRRQARNLYLNMHHGTDLRKTSWSWILLRSWYRLKEQPLRHLPLRMARKLMKLFRPGPVVQD